MRKSMTADFRIEQPLPKGFYARPTAVVARELVGKALVSERGGCRTAGFIVEVEAYLGQEDAASHAARGRTPRSAIMFGAPGMAYVYFIYGMHHCLNIVTEQDGVAGAVLIRALEPLVGDEIMSRRRTRKVGRIARGAAHFRQLCNGPGKLCQAMGIDLSWNGLVLDGATQKGRRIWLTHGPEQAPRIAAVPRVGIRRAKEAPLRYLDRDSEFLSVRWEECSRGV